MKWRRLEAMWLYTDLLQLVVISFTCFSTDAPFCMSHRSTCEWSAKHARWTRFCLSLPSITSIFSPQLARRCRQSSCGWNKQNKVVRLSKKLSGNAHEDSDTLTNILCCNYKCEPLKYDNHNICCLEIMSIPNVVQMSKT